MNFEQIMFTNHIVLKPGTLGVCKQTFRCSISVTIFSVLIWDTYFCSVSMIPLDITIIIIRGFYHRALIFFLGSML